ncbi:MAG: SDR family oxidoreductase [Nitrospiraceae bacterium]|nr:SDR family oxidoreductase [Nitrospiraceae bacterium]
MRILIIGGTGMIGHRLWLDLGRRFPDVHTIIHGKKSQLEWTGLYGTGPYNPDEGDRVMDGVDVMDFRMLYDILAEIRPDVILNCAGITKRKTDSGNTIPSLVLNSFLPHRLAEWASERGARVFQFSTDCVFSGSPVHGGPVSQGGYYREESPPTARDIYGQSKYLGELKEENCLTLRTSFIGREITGFTELLEWFLAQEGQTIKGFRRALYTGVSTVFLSRVVGDLIEYHPRLSGLYHLSGEVISKYDLLCLARDAFGLDVEIVPDDDFLCARTLIGSRFREATGIEVSPWSRMMEELAEEDVFYQAVRRRHASQAIYE